MALDPFQERAFVRATGHHRYARIVLLPGIGFEIQSEVGFAFRLVGAVTGKAMGREYGQHIPAKPNRFFGNQPLQVDRPKGYRNRREPQGFCRVHRCHPTSAVEGHLGRPTKISRSCREKNGVGPRLAPPIRIRRAENGIQIICGILQCDGRFSADE